LIGVEHSDCGVGGAGGDTRIDHCCEGNGGGGGETVGGTGKSYIKS
jgi:hypothetical protein